MIGLLTLLSLMTSLSGGLTQAWADFLHRWIGWGSYAFQLVFAFDRSLVFAFKDGSLSGVHLNEFLNYPALFQSPLLVSITGCQFWQPVHPPGGGILGGAPYRGLESGLGRAGTGIVLIAWLLVALVLLIDLSMSEPRELAG
jgi:hypothetical protein